MLKAYMYYIDGKWELKVNIDDTSICELVGCINPALQPAPCTGCPFDEDDVKVDSPELYDALKVVKQEIINKFNKHYKENGDHTKGFYRLRSYC